MRAAALAALLAAGCAATPPVPHPASPTTPSASAPAAPPRATVSSVEKEPERPAPPSLPAAEPAAPPPDLRILPDSGRAALGPRDLRGLQGIAQRVKEPRGASVSIESYSSWHGSREFNMALAQQRADEVKDALTKLGVPPGRIRTTAYGEERRSDAPAERSRIDIRVTEAGG